MRAKNIHAVYTAWLNGRAARSGNVSTDGSRLWSYSLLIGVVSQGGGAAVGNYTRSGEFVSMTTSKHVGAAARAAGVECMHPDAFETGPGRWRPGRV